MNANNANPLQDFNKTWRIMPVM